MSDQSVPSISILVPVYNVSKYLPQCLDSLTRQTFTDIEIVCVDDGSTDGSSNILREYASQDNRIRIVTKKNGGLPSARNAGINVARGKFLAFVDGDDWVETDMFEVMYSLAKSSNAEIVICGGKTFPDESDAPEWIKAALSPSDRVIRNFGPEVLFTESGIRPFLWRYMVRRDLIERNHFRLDEDVIIGEDQAFQFKVLPAANCIATTSRKLYNYRWSRPDSIMNASKFKDYSYRVSRHVFMIRSIIDSWADRLSNKDVAIPFFEWAVDFIYWDIIRVSQYDRAKIAGDFCSVLAENKYYLHLKHYSQETRVHFDYMLDISKRVVNRPSISVAVVFDSNGRYLKDALDSILDQHYKDVEILLYPNNADDSTMDIIRNLLWHDCRICLRMGDWQPVSEKYNDAIVTAKGDSILFLNEFEYYVRSDWFDEIIEIFTASETVDMVGYVHGFQGLVSMIRDNNVLFDDYALLIGSVFFTRCCQASNDIIGVDECLSEGIPFRRTSIYAEEARLTLRAIVWLMKCARDNNLSDLLDRLTIMLNSENYARLISDAESSMRFDEQLLQNPLEDCHTEILSLLLQANALKANDNCGAVLRSLSALISTRHKILERY